MEAHRYYEFCVRNYRGIIPEKWLKVIMNYRNSTLIGRIKNADNYTQWNERACPVVGRDDHGPAWKSQHLVPLLFATRVTRIKSGGDANGFTIGRGLRHSLKRSFPRDNKACFRSQLRAEWQAMVLFKGTLSLPTKEWQILSRRTGFASISYLKQIHCSPAAHQQRTSCRPQYQRTTRLSLPA